MACRNIVDKIICEHKSECKRYSVWIGDGKFSDCINCKNNKYIEPNELKKDYYEPDTKTKILNIIVMLLIFGFIFGVIYLIWLG